MMRIIKKLNAFFECLLSTTAYICSALVFFLIISVSYDVGARYFFNRPTSWTTETAAFIILILSFFAAAYILKRGTHVRMDLVYNALRIRYKLILDIVTSFLSMLICAILIWRGSLVTLDLYAHNTLTPTTLRVVQWPFMAIIPIGLFFFFFEYMRSFFRAIIRLLAKG